jgi:hypothetical protein
MRRRQFIGFLGGSAVAWPLGAHAQQSSGMKCVAILNGNGCDKTTRRANHFGLSNYFF